MRAVCKICGSTAIHLRIVNGLFASRCTACGLLFICPLPSQDHIRRAYAEIDADAYYGLSATAEWKKNERAFSNLSSMLKEGAKVLDVGCGDGQFLSLLSKKRPDLILFGIDLSAHSVRKARARNLNVALADISSVREQFDAITLLDVAEHLPNPSTFFASCYHLLGERGILYLHTPRICAWDRLLQRANFWMKTRLSIYHLQLWSDKALETALRNSGFTVLWTKAERELSWPIHKYVETYVDGYIFYPALLCAHLLALTLKNKAIVTAIRKSPCGNFPIDPVSLSART